MSRDFRPQDEQQRKAQEAMDWAEQDICQTHYGRLSSLEARPLLDRIRAIRPGDVACMFQIKELVFDRREGSIAPLSIVLNSLHACGASCILVLQCQGGRSELYIGAVNKLHPDTPFYLSTIHFPQRYRRTVGAVHRQRLRQPVHHGNLMRGAGGRARLCPGDRTPPGGHRGQELHAHGPCRSS